MPSKKDIPNLLIDAALKLAAERDWHDVTMIDIANEAGVTVADCYDHCSSKADILRRFVKRVDREVLADLESEDFNEPGHDRLIAVIMARFDILADHRSALRSIINAGGDLGPADGLRAIKTHFGAMRWMLEAAGFQTSGLHGSMRVAGLTAVYAKTFKHWLDDDSTDFGPTMAYLDRELSKAAGWDRRVEKGFGKASSICGKITKRCRNFSLKKSTSAGENSPSDSTSDQGASPAANG
ncbi:TetR family transcriptional regulator [Thalassospira sp.]|uniref:TetR family transcriptional regulator n=1 Tax=Thalassospira sp. TaxID=1912094 RepID=UPI000C62392C|nr:TetR family transcriptional regulator [Thalassospira sp.]MBC06278.1 TetR family transcriptional regulator [Thalassospira sp.]|tara:strand:- start:2269 stop:2985 length:717 start_codon:yes stop_codon:yes gene_type:complete